MPTIGKFCVTRKAVSLQDQVSDIKEPLCDAKNSWFPVDVDNRETLYDDKSVLCACSRER